MTHHDGMMFTTFDKDQDLREEGNTLNCAELFCGANWYRNCFRQNMNGAFFSTELDFVPFDHRGTQWMTWPEGVAEMNFSEWKIRPRPT